MFHHQIVGADTVRLLFEQDVLTSFRRSVADYPELHINKYRLLISKVNLMVRVYLFVSVSHYLVVELLTVKRSQQFIDDPAIVKHL